MLCLVFDMMACLRQKLHRLGELPTLFGLLLLRIEIRKKGTVIIEPLGYGVAAALADLTSRESGPDPTPAAVTAPGATPY